VCGVCVCVCVYGVVCVGGVWVCVCGVCVCVCGVCVCVCHWIWLGAKMTLYEYNQYAEAGRRRKKKERSPFYNSYNETNQLH